MDSQEQYWSSTALSNGYCEKQLTGLNQIAVLEMLAAALKKIDFEPRRILEIGGGSQFVSRYLCECFPNAEIICTDISQERVCVFEEFYKTTPPNLKVMGGVDARILPFADECFDLIVGDAMLHHIDFLKPALFEVKRCLSPKGQAIFVREPVIGFLGLLTYRFFQIIGRSKKHIEINYFEYKRMLSQWQYEFMMAGFKVEYVKFWKQQGIHWKLRNVFPHLTPGYIGFILSNNDDVSKLDIK